MIAQSNECEFCRSEILGVFSHGCAPVSYGVCEEHMFLLSCSLATMAAARECKALGVDYTYDTYLAHKQ